MSKEALTLALDEFKHIKQWCLRSIGIGLVNENVISALEEALAKQEGQSNFCPNCEALSRELKAIKQEQGEPVALETVYETIIHWDEGGGKRSRRELAKRIAALYTTPQPAQKPLTDEQINELRKAYLRVSELDGYSIHGQWEFARAIEAAHGIKENT